MSKDQGYILKLEGVNNYEQWKIEASAAWKERRLWKYVKDNTYSGKNIIVQDTGDQDHGGEGEAQDVKGHYLGGISKEAWELQDGLDATLGFLVRSCKLR